MRYMAAIGGVLAMVLVSTQAEAADALWEASSGVLPDSACPPWVASVGESILLSPASLRIGTTACNRNVFYLQTGADIQLPDTVVVEARRRFESGSECLGPCGHFRQAAVVTITTAPQVGTLFFVGNDEIFVTNGECSGITGVNVDTNGSAHTYRIVVTSGGSVTVHYDGVPVLTGHTYTSSSDHASSPRIFWGEGSSFAYGTSHWEYVRHNAHATGCVPTSVGAAAASDEAAGAPSFLARPNPFSAETTLRYAITRPGRVRIDLYDVSGRWVRSLLDAESAPGVHRITWDGLDAGGKVVRPGQYAYRIETSYGTRTGKILRLP